MPVRRLVSGSIVDRCRHGVLAALLVLSGTGCAAATQSLRGGPAGIVAEVGLRDQLVQGQYGSAFEALKKKEIAPADALLRHMYRGVVALHAGQHEVGARSMDRAWSIAYERWTKRVGDAALSMVTSDAARPYDPGPAEHMFIPYYGGLTWLARNERESAAVEARRLSTLLASNRDDQPADDFRGVMRYVAGVMYELAGERNDADVSFRNAALLLKDGLPGDTVPPDAAHGDVVILMEDGFVGRPEPASLTFWFNDDELKSLSHDDASVRLTTVGALSGRRRAPESLLGVPYRHVLLSWPRFGEAERDPAPLAARAMNTSRDSLIATADLVSADVTSAVRADFERRQPARLARAIARSAIREAALDAAGDAISKGLESEDEDGKKKKGGDRVLSFLFGLVLGAGAVASAVLDVADLRAWQLLPDRLTVARLRLPVGDHSIEVLHGSDVVSLGTVSVRPGSVTMLTHRWWPDDRARRTLVENGGKLPHDLPSGPDVVDAGHGFAGLPVLRVGIGPHQ